MACLPAPARRRRRRIHPDPLAARSSGRPSPRCEWFSQRRRSPGVLAAALRHGASVVPASNGSEWARDGATIMRAAAASHAAVSVCDRRQHRPSRGGTSCTRAVRPPARGPPLPTSVTLTLLRRLCTHVDCTSPSLVPRAPPVSRPWWTCFTMPSRSLQRHHTRPLSLRVLPPLLARYVSASASNDRCCVSTPPAAA